MSRHATFLATLAVLALPAWGQQSASPGVDTTACLVQIEVERGAASCDPCGASANESGSCTWDWLLPFGIQPEVRTERGAGFVARADGLIVTSQALVDGARALTVSLNDGRRLAGDVVAVHSATQTAVVRVDLDWLPALRMRASADLSPGSAVTLEGAASPSRALGVIGGRAEDDAVVALFCGPQDALLGTPLVAEDGTVVGINAHVTPFPPPLLGALGVVCATPTEAARELIAEIPLRTPLFPRLSFGTPELDLGLDFDWGSLIEPRFPMLPRD